MSVASSEYRVPTYGGIPSVSSVPPWWVLTLMLVLMFDLVP
jgi:hypothetical protein